MRDYVATHETVPAEPAGIQLAYDHHIVNRCFTSGSSERVTFRVSGSGIGTLIGDQLPH